MNDRWVPIAASLCAILVLSCGNPSLPVSGGTDAGQDGGSASSGAQSIEFDSPLPLKCRLNQALPIGMHVSPPAIYHIRLALLGDFADASLGRDEVTTDATGRITVVLTAPSSARTFHLRASVDKGPSVEATISVAANGFANVLVRPEYAGIRPVDTWTASALVGMSCDDLTPYKPITTGLSSTAKDGSILRLIDVPAETKLAVAVLHAKNIWGCADVQPLAPDESPTMIVQTSDRPIDLSHVDLGCTMTATNTSATNIIAFAKTHTSDFVDEFFPPGRLPSTILLDEMKEDFSDDSAFSSARKAYHWDGLISKQWKDSGITPKVILRDWISVGLTSLTDRPPIVGTLRSVSTGDDLLLLDISSFLGVPMQDAFVDEHHLLTAHAEPNDEMHMGGSIFWWPSGLLGQAALTRARQDDPTLQTFPPYFAKQLHCQQIGQILATYDLPHGWVCDGSCFTSACNQAVSRRWHDAVSLSSKIAEMARFEFSTSGTGDVDDDARFVGLDAPWIGFLQKGTNKFPISGKAHVGPTSTKPSQ